jgi:hypothetical protein
MEPIMLTLLVLLPVTAYFVYHSKLACVLRSLPNNNDDFVLF